MIEGFILIDKTVGITSFDVISILRRITGIKKIGHAGTLDPLASGLLVCAIGRQATKNIDLFLKQDKIYIAEIELGKVSNTYDMEGEITQNSVPEIPEKLDIEKLIKKFIGQIDQTPPIYSAKKINGIRAYKLARDGSDVKLKNNKVNIYSINIISYNFPILKIRINCGSGTYIRSLAHDIGDKLGTGAILRSLIRKKIGKFDLDKAVKVEKLSIDEIQKNIFAI